MCKLFVVNSLYLGNRSLGLELWDGKGVVEMTEKQVRDGLNAGKEIYGLKVSPNGIDLDIDTDGFYMNNLVIHRHIGNYQPMFETENPVSIMYIVTGMRDDKGVKVYDLISSRFEVKPVGEDLLRSLFLMGAVCGGAKMDGSTIVMAPERKKKEPKKEVPEQPEEKKDSVKDKGKSEPTQGTVKKEVDKKEAGTSSKKESASKADKDDSKKAVKK